MLAERGAPIDDDAIARGIAATRWPGRLERIADRSRQFIWTARITPPRAREMAVFWEAFLSGTENYPDLWSRAR